jgi:hypothetical protein
MVQLDIWRGKENVSKISALKDYDKDFFLIKKELLPNGTTKLILKNKNTGEIIHKEM